MNFRTIRGPAVIVNTVWKRDDTQLAETDCACPSPFSSDIHKHRIERLKSDHLPLNNRVLYQNLVTKLDGPEIFTTLASPYAESSVAVLNRKASELWEQFEDPISSLVALQRLKVSTTSLSHHKAIAKLYLNGFLTDHPNAKTPQAREDTLIAWLHITNACNLRCNYCYLAKTREKMDEQVGRQAMEAIFRSAKINRFSKIKIKYAGGEATLNFPLITRLHSYACKLASAHEIALDAVVLSNGVRLHHNMVQYMSKCNLRLMISLDGVGINHDRQRRFANGNGSFAHVARNIEMAQEMGLTPNICATVTGRSVDGVPELIEWILERDLPFSINFYRDNEVSGSPSELYLDEDRIIRGMLAAFKVIETNLPRRSLLNSLVDRANLSASHSRPCAAGHSYMVIDNNGRVAKCQMEITKPVTNVSAKDPLALIRADMVGLQNYTVDEKEGCQDCKWKYWCAGGCPQATFRATGRYDIKSPNCNIYKALYPEVLRLEALRLLKDSDSLVT